MKRRIEWHWWDNPLGGGAEWADEAEKKPPERDRNFYEEDGDEDDTLVRPVVNSAAGLVPVGVYGQLAKNFDLWIGHTNFGLEQPLVDLMKAVPGVETFDVLTRYRFRLGVGLAFKSAEVKDAIMEAVDARRRVSNPGRLRFDGETEARIAEARAGLQGYWALYAAPNGKFDICQTGDPAGHKERLAVYESAQALAGGVVYSSHDL